MVYYADSHPFRRGQLFLLPIEAQR